MYYHVDRLSRLSIGECQTSLGSATSWRQALLTRLQRHVGTMFPSGMSRHGDKHFLGSGSSASVATPAIELLFEYVCVGLTLTGDHLDSRVGLQPHRSRRLERFAANFVRGSAESGWLTLQGSVLQLSRAAHKYWNGDRGRVSPYWELLLTPPVTVRELADAGLGT